MAGAAEKEAKASILGDFVTQQAYKLLTISTLRLAIIENYPTVKGDTNNSLRTRKSRFRMFRMSIQLPGLRSRSRSQPYSTVHSIAFWL